VGIGSEEDEQHAEDGEDGGEPVDLPGVSKKRRPKRA